MKSKMILCLLVAPLLTTGCLAVGLASLVAPAVGNAIHNSKKTSDAVLGNGVTLEMLQSKKNIGLSINGVSTNGQMMLTGGAGTTNGSVFSDMISKEFLRLGYQSRVVLDTISEMMPKAKLGQLADKGFDLILVGHLNLGMSSNYSTLYVGGDFMKTGVTSFTVKGIDMKSGNVLFILSSEYGSAKTASEVAVDVSQSYRDMLQGTLKVSKK